MPIKERVFRINSCKMNIIKRETLYKGDCQWQLVTFSSFINILSIYANLQLWCFSIYQI